MGQFIMVLTIWHTMKTLIRLKSSLIRVYNICHSILEQNLKTYMTAIYLISFLSFSSSGLALFNTLRKSDVFALILEWMYA